jgi:hypothetical protein
VFLPILTKPTTAKMLSDDLSGNDTLVILFVSFPTVKHNSFG